MELLEQREIFELLPTHGKVVTLDADLPMKYALAALSHHGAVCLPVWDSALQRFVDVFSCTDLIDIILYAHRTLAGGAMQPAGTAPPSAGGGDAQTALERCALREVNNLKRSKPSGFLMASVDDSIYHGACMLMKHGLECLPIGDSACSSSLLHLLMPEQILAFLATLPEFRVSCGALLDQPIGQALLSLCRPLQTVHRSSPLIDALALLSSERLAALPVMDDAGGLHDVLSCRDVRQLATHSTADLSMRLDEALCSLPPNPIRLHSCPATDTVASAVIRLANPEVPQLICLNASGGVCGVLTASAVLAALLPNTP